MKILKWRDCKTDEDRFAYHAHVYAWRIFRGHAKPEDRTSPNDPTGRWYDADAVKAALADMRAEAERLHSKRALRLSDREVRTRLDWARGKGYATWNDFLDAVQAGKESVLPYLDWYKAEFFPGSVGGFKTPGEVLKPPVPPARNPDEQEEPF